MKSIFRIRIHNFKHSRPFVASALLNSTGSGLLMAFLLVYFDRTTDVGLALIGVSITVGRSVAAVVPAFIGRWLDHVGPRRVAIVGDILTAVGFMVCLGASNAALIAVSQVLAQAGSHMFWTSSRGLVDIASHGQGKHAWFGLVGSLRNIGLGVGTLASSLAFSVGSVTALHGVVLACAGLYLLSSGALMVWQSQDAAAVSSGTDEQPAQSEHADLRQVWSDKPYSRLLVLNVGLVLAAMVIPLVIAVYATDQLGLPALLAGGLVLTNTVVVALFSTHVAAWTDHIPAIGSIKIGYVANIVAFVLFWLASSVAVVGTPIMAAGMLALAMLIYTVAEMVTTPAVNVLSLELAPARGNGSYLAAFQLTWSIGMTLTPALFGWLLTSGPNATWITLIALTVLCLVAGTSVGAGKET